MTADPPARRRVAWLGSVLVVGLWWSGCGRPSAVSEAETPPPPVEARAAVDRALATTGDLITYRLTVDRDPTYEVEIPEAGAEIAGFRIVDLGRAEPSRSRGRIVEERWYELRADLVGSYVLPPIVVRFRPLPSAPESSPPTDARDEDWSTVSTSEIFVEVESVLPADGEAEDIRGLKPLHRVRKPLAWRWLVAGLAAALLLGVAAWLYRRRLAQRSRAAPPVPPHELAFRALDALRRTDFDDARAVRRFYFQISEILREYVEGRFDLNATDLTTEEILARLPGLIDLERYQDELLRQFLVDSDRVKFAHHRPSKSEVEDIYEKALSFVESTRPDAQVLQQEAA